LIESQPPSIPRLRCPHPGGPEGGYLVSGKTGRCWYCGRIHPEHKAPVESKGAKVKGQIRLFEGRGI
jgi:hypothetical protein